MTRFRMMMRPPGWPLVPFLFPMGLMFGLLGFMAYLQYRSYCELKNISEQRATLTGGQSGF